MPPNQSSELNLPQIVNQSEKLFKLQDYSRMLIADEYDIKEATIFCNSLDSNQIVIISVHLEH